MGLGWLLHDLLTWYRATVSQNKLVENMNNWRNEKYEKKKTEQQKS